VQYGKESSLAVVAFIGPGIGPEMSVRLAAKVEHMDCAIPNSLALMLLMDRHRLDKRGRAAVLGFHGLFEFGWGYFVQNKVPCFRPASSTSQQDLH